MDSRAPGRLPPPPPPTAADGLWLWAVRVFAGGGPRTIPGA